jgi:hypothetical protein
MRGDGGLVRRAALGEAAAHLHLLEVQGEVRRIPGDVVRWQLLD